MAGLGLVLGGGGVVGVAWEIGVLDGLVSTGALALDDVTVYVGTSAGSIVGGLLLLGQPLSKLVADEENGAPTGLPTAATAGSPAAAPAPATLPAADPAARMTIFQKWGQAGDMTAPLARELAELAGRSTDMEEDDWVSSLSARLAADGRFPSALRVVATNGSTGERAVFTSSSGVALERAVAASCAVPGIFPPVVIDGAPHIDGNVWSSGSADVLIGEGFDRALFIGPLVGDTGIGLLGARSLERERAALADAGIALTTITPGDAFKAAGFSLMDPTRRPEALQVGQQEGKSAATTI